MTDRRYEVTLIDQIGSWLLKALKAFARYYFIVIYFPENGGYLSVMYE